MKVTAPDSFTSHTICIGRPSFFYSNGPNSGCLFSGGSEFGSPRSSGPILSDAKSGGPIWVDLPLVKSCQVVLGPTDQKPVVPEGSNFHTTIIHVQ